MAVEISHHPAVQQFMDHQPVGEMAQDQQPRLGCRFLDSPDEGQYVDVWLKPVTEQDDIWRGSRDQFEEFGKNQPGSHDLERVVPIEYRLYADEGEVTVVRQCDLDHHADTHW